MTCSWCEARFERLLDGDLSAPERAAVLAHVDTCGPCRSLYEEFRTVDALLATGTPIEPAADFVARTMADVRTIPPPRPFATPVRAYVVCYVVAAWGLILSAALLDPRRTHAAGAWLLGAAHTFVVAAAGMLHVETHLGGHGELGAWTQLAGGFALADLAIVVVLLAALRFARPRSAERRS